MIIVPYIEVNGVRSLSDDQIMELWDLLERDNTAKIVFCEGNVKNRKELLYYFKRPDIFMHTIFLENRPVFVAWLNQIGNHHAFAHWFSFKEIWGKKTTEAMQRSFEYWFSFKKNGEPVFKVLLGEMSVDNNIGCKFIEKCGATKVGIIPYIIDDFYQHKDKDAVLYYLTRGQWENGEKIRWQQRQ